MKRKDYILIASVFKEAIDSLKDQISIERGQELDKLNRVFYSIEILVQALSNKLHQDNDKFDARRFYEACGL